jgi:DNA-binding NtrC family response regulator
VPLIYVCSPQTEMVPILLSGLRMGLTARQVEAYTSMEKIGSPTAVSAASEVRHPLFVPGRSAAMRAVGKIATGWPIRRIPILLVGEAGTGKRALAAQIHRTCASPGSVLRIVNCSCLTGDLLGKNGHSENGDALREVSGADTYLLENICDLAPSLQSRMLALVATAFASEDTHDGCLIATSDRELLQEVHAGAFREDLYYLISGITVPIPPLRHRREDILPLIDHFLEECARELQRPVPGVTISMRRLLCDYPWPGNVAELRNTARVMVAFGDAELAMAALRSRAQDAQRGGSRTVISLKQTARAASRQAERGLILNVLGRTGWNRKRAAQELQISYKALLYKLKQLGLDAKVS